MIADEAERLANLLPVITMRKPHGRHPISKDLFVSSLRFCSILIERMFLDNDESATRFRRSLAAYSKIFSDL